MDEERNEIIEEKIIRLRRLSERLDETFRIPGTNHKVGIESIIGAIPLVGDLIGGLISAYIIYSGIKMGVPPKIITQMAVNVVIDFVIGSIPIVGDLFDFIWKSNMKNIELIEKTTALDNEENKINYLIVASLIIALVATIFGILAVIS